VRKTPFFWRHFVYQTDQFTKTGSGQNIGKVEKREAFLCAGDDKLAGTVSEIWVEFAHTGNPGQTPEGQEWEPYDAAARRKLHFGNGGSTEMRSDDVEHARFEVLRAAGMFPWREGSGVEARL
jgi:carboxylesterase type B